jgi:type VI secretion system secreted protein VgrG
MVSSEKRNDMKCYGLGSAAIIGMVTILFGASPASAQTAPSLGSADSFAVLAGSTVTNTGTSVITGDVGVSPGGAITGFPPGILVAGTIHSGDSVATAAQASVITAYNNLAGQTCPAPNNLTGQNLGNRTLIPGVYCYATSAQLTGTLTLDAQANPAAVFIFQIGTTLTTASSSNVVMTNGGSRCNVFWQVGSSATLGTTTSLAGNILALTSITMTTSAGIFNGRALARNGAVTLDTNTVTGVGCFATPPVPVPIPPTPTPTPTPTPVPTLSEWAFIMLALLLATAGVARLRGRRSSR